LHFGNIYSDVSCHYTSDSFTNITAVLAISDNFRRQLQCSLGICLAVFVAVTLENTETIFPPARPPEFRKQIAHALIALVGSFQPAADAPPLLLQFTPRSSDKRKQSAFLSAMFSRLCANSEYLFIYDIVHIVQIYKKKKKANKTINKYY